ncbi:MAG: glycosyltransferase family 2 protein [Intrasporangium sp.]|uniref:glycosyltransferase n=1 Tax=Intrasporangium sp. TaxID=1925024 RepID=UPI0026492D1F|nr:glycosyltransferase family 2 protein [Intrasporangium sp.]MDN5795497.1 glycosyltransferase family 2 protein [Intrasporangium sp.]
MTSVVIAAHDEASVIGRCLDALLSDAQPDELDITVVPNGCSDATAAIASSRPVRVVDIDQANKPAALNAGDEVAVGFPRLYLDADMMVTADDVRLLVEALSPSEQPVGDAPRARLAAAPRRALDLTGRPWPVRAYFAVSGRLPAFDHALFGRGAIVLSERARQRFDRFPDMVADDLFLDSLFSDREKVVVEAVVTTVATPFRTRDLVNRLVRVRRGNAAMRRAGDGRRFEVQVRPSDRTSWLRDVVLPDPRLAPAGAVYAVITLLAALLARRSPQDDMTWHRDESTRADVPPPSEPRSTR